jgi:peptidoglycan/LPS O-acetylase OafA/YrhL
LAGYARTAAAAGLYVQDFVYSFSGPHGGFGITWSLAVEEQFYLVWPPNLIIALRRGKTRLALTLAVVAILVAVANQVLIDANLVPSSFFTPWLNATPLIIGCFLAVVLAESSDRVSPRLGPSAAAAAAVAGVVGLGAMWIVANRVGNGHFYSFQLLGCATSSAALISGSNWHLDVASRGCSVGSRPRV